MTNGQSFPDGRLGDDEVAWRATRSQRGGAAGIVQLFHGGVRAASQLTGEQVWSASTWHEDSPGFETPRAATDDDIARVIEQFAAAAARCERAGFDGVELDESLQVAAWLAEDGADFIHASLWDASKPTAKRPAEHPTPLLRAALPKHVRVIVAGTIWTHEEAEAALAKGADMVAIGRAAILNPDWPRPGAERRPPMTRADLAARAVSPVFVESLPRWKNFVAD